MESISSAKLIPTEGALVDLLIPHSGVRVDRPYRLKTYINYYSARYNKWIVLHPGFLSDGATKAIDVKGSVAWLVHDYLCVYGMFHDGTLCTNWQASRILTDILKDDGYWFRCRSWLLPTWLFGGGKCREKMW